MRGLLNEINNIKKWMVILGENIEYNIDEFHIDTGMYPEFNLEKFKSLTSFKDRVAYCNATLKKLGAGSSRVVYQIDPVTVLKLAKNGRGVQQNRTEANEYGHDYFSEVRTNVYDYDDENELWVISEMGKPITPEVFEKETGINFRLFDHYVQLREGQNNGKKITDKDFLTYMTPDQLKLMDDDDFVGKVVEFMFNNGLSAGDVGRISSWGIVNRDGHNMVVLMDYGYTGSYK